MTIEEAKMFLEKNGYEVKKKEPSKTEVEIHNSEWVSSDDLIHDMYRGSYRQKLYLTEERLKMIRCDGYIGGTKVYEVEGRSYDGCNGWHTWACEGKQTMSFAKAQQYCSEMNDRGRSTGDRYTVKERMIYQISLYFD